MLLKYIKYNPSIDISIRITMHNVSHINLRYDCAVILTKYAEALFVLSPENWSAKKGVLGTKIFVENWS